MNKLSVLTSLTTYLSIVSDYCLNQTNASVGCHSLFCDAYCCSVVSYLNLTDFTSVVGGHYDMNSLYSAKRAVTNYTWMITTFKDDIMNLLK